MELNYNNYLKNISDDDVIDRNENLFKSGKVKKALESAFDNAVPDALNRHCSNQGVSLSLNNVNQWFDEGVDCKILQAGSSGWKSGKLKINITVEFIPDESEVKQYESPLDEIRREIEASKLS